MVRNPLLTPSFTPEFTYRSDELVRQFCHSASFASGRIAARNKTGPLNRHVSLLHCILNVVFLRTKKYMAFSDPDARRIIAAMIALFAGRERAADSQFQGKTMSIDHFACELKSTIAFVAAVAGPEPAIIGLLDARPKSVGRSIKRFAAPRAKQVRFLLPSKWKELCAAIRAMARNINTSVWHSLIVNTT